MSKLVPNSFQTPNVLVDQYMAYLTDAELRCYLYLTRRTIGFWRRTDHVALSQFEHGLRDSAGNHLDYGTGLTRPTIVKALRGLQQFNLASVVSPNNDLTDEGTEYALQLDSTQVDFAGLVERAKGWRDRDRQRTTKARATRASQRATQEVCATNQQGSGLCDKPAEVCATNQQRFVRQTHNMSVEKQLESNGCPSPANDAGVPFDDSPLQHVQPDDSITEPGVDVTTLPQRPPNLHQRFVRGIIKCQGLNPDDPTLPERTLKAAQQTSRILRQAGRTIDELQDYYVHRLDDNEQRRARGARPWWPLDVGSLREDFSRFLTERAAPTPSREGSDTAEIYVRGVGTLLNFTPDSEGDDD